MTAFPEQVALQLSADWLRRIDRAAEAGGYGRDELLRRLVRRAPDSNEHTELRREAV